MISVHVHPNGTPVWVTCSLCPSWRPEFVDEAKAHEIGRCHDEVAHGVVVDPDYIEPTTTVDIVVVHRLTLYADEDASSRIHSLTHLLAKSGVRLLGDNRIIRGMGLRASSSASFSVDLPVERLDYTITTDEITRIAHTWNEDPE